MAYPPNQLLDIERRMESAGLELLKAWTLLVTLTGVDRIRTARDKAKKADYPASTIEGAMMTEFGRHTGWYDGLMRLSALSFETDDKDREVVKQILGANRGFMQQEDLVAQMNATASAAAAGTELTVEYIECDGTEYEGTELERVNELIIEARILARPS